MDQPACWSSFKSLIGTEAYMLAFWPACYNAGWAYLWARILKKWNYFENLVVLPTYFSISSLLYFVVHNVMEFLISLMWATWLFGHRSIGTICYSPVSSPTFGIILKKIHFFLLSLELTFFSEVIWNYGKCRYFFDWGRHIYPWYIPIILCQKILIFIADWMIPQ